MYIRILLWLNLNNWGFLESVFMKTPQILGLCWVTNCSYECLLKRKSCRLPWTWVTNKDAFAILGCKWTPGNPNLVTTIGTSNLVVKRSNCYTTKPQLCLLYFSFSLPYRSAKVLNASIGHKVIFSSHNYKWSPSEAVTKWVRAPIYLKCICLFRYGSSKSIKMKVLIGNLWVFIMQILHAKTLGQLRFIFILWLFKNIYCVNSWGSMWGHWYANTINQHIHKAKEAF